MGRELRRASFWIAALIGVAVAVYVAGPIARFWAEDTCLDLGGAVRRIQQVCEQPSGRVVPLNEWPPTVAGKIVLALIAVIPGALTGFLPYVLLRLSAARPRA